MKVEGRGESFFLPGVEIVVDQFVPPDAIYAVCDAGLPADVEAKLAKLPEGPERDLQHFVELAQRGHVVVGRNVKLQP